MTYLFYGDNRLGLSKVRRELHPILGYNVLTLESKIRKIRRFSKLHLFYMQLLHSI